MKKIFLLLAFIAISLTSCSKDDDSSTAVTEANLSKKWYYKSYEVAGQTIPYDNEACGRDYIEFKASGVMIDYSIWACDPLESYTDTGGWALSGNTITTNFDGEIFSVTVTGLTSTTLQVATETDYDDNGTTENVKLNFTAN